MPRWIFSESLPWVSAIAFTSLKRLPMSFRQEPRRQPAVAERCCPSSSRLRSSRRPTAAGWVFATVWDRSRRLEFDEPAVVACRVIGPDGFHRAQVIVGDLAALFSIHAQHFVLTRLDRRRRADADADVEAAVAQDVEGGDLFGGEQWIAARNDDAGDAEANFMTCPAMNASDVIASKKSGLALPVCESSEPEEICVR